MPSTLIHNDEKLDRVEPLCAVFGECGGCRYQDISYEQELLIKQDNLQQLLIEKAGIAPEVFAPILPSPQSYHYRNRLDLKLTVSKNKDVLIGFSPEGINQIIPIDTCPIARQSICDFLPQVKEQAIKKLTSKYRMANLVVRTGDDDRVFWGGVGRRSLRLNPQDYLWTEIEGKRIHYSLETFFQANLFILPDVIRLIRNLPIWGKDVVFFDLYGGVGLFGVCLADMVRKVILIEDHIPSINIARYNLEFNHIANLETYPGQVETVLSPILKALENQAVRKIAFIDPPRAGLSSSATQFLCEDKALETILYLSCHPESLARDLALLMKAGWKIEKVFPLDFFPKTKHIETLAMLTRRTS